MWIKNKVVPVSQSVKIIGLNSNKLPKTTFVESNDQLFTDVDNRYTHLSAFLYHFFPLLKVSCNVVIGELHVVRREKIFCCMAKMARGGRINGHLFRRHDERSLCL